MSHRRCFYQGLRASGRVRPEVQVLSWIYRIAVNKSLHGLSRRHRVEPIDEEAPDDHPGPDDEVGSEQVSRHVQGPDAAETGTPRRHRAETPARLSYEDISEILQLPEKTVKSRLFTARQLLKDVLLNQGTSRS